MGALLHVTSGQLQMLIALLHVNSGQLHMSIALLHMPSVSIQKSQYAIVLIN